MTAKRFKSFEEAGIDTIGKRFGNFKTKCPACTESRKNKKDKPLSVKLSAPGEGVFNCHNCGWAGYVGAAGSFVPQKQYVLPDYNNTPLSDDTLRWFVETRKISKATLLAFKVTENTAKSGVKWVNFNYFREGELINVKYRKSDEKRFMMAKDAELIFYNLDAIAQSATCIITEGEIDCMSVYEASPGSKAVSVPNGASKGNQKLEYFDNCFEYFENKTEVILATDDDEAGISLREELARRIGKEKCFYVEYPEGCKDLNEVLVKLGSEEVKSCIENAVPYPLPGIKYVANVQNELAQIFRFGYPKGLEVGFPELDKLITFRTGELTTVTGIPGSGKSEFIDELTYRLAKDHDWTIGYLSAENQPVQLHVAKMMERYTGKKLYASYNQHAVQMSEEQYCQALEFMNNHFLFVGIDEENDEQLDMSIDGIFSMIDVMIFRFGIKCFVLDPWNMIEHNIPKNMTETQYTSVVLTKITNYSKRKGIHFILVAHPKKPQKDKATGKYPVQTMYDISGSSHFFNKTDNGLSVWRDFETGIVEVHVQKIRFKFIGKVGMSAFNYDTLSGRYTETYA